MVQASQTTPNTPLLLATFISDVTHIRPCSATNRGATLLVHTNVQDHCICRQPDVSDGDTT